MSFPEGLVKKPRTIGVQENAMDAARIMASYGIGSLIVIDADRPVGVVTDRDLALKVLCNELDPEFCMVGDCMNDEVVSICEEEGTTKAIDLMRRYEIRRLPVVTKEGRLVGIVSSDDLIISLAHDLTDLSSVIRTEISQENTKKPPVVARLGGE